MCRIILVAVFSKAVYQEVLGLEFSDKIIPFEAQKRITITYRDRVLTKEYIADSLCFGKIIVEIKAIKEITEIEEAQLIYLKAAKLPLGLIINFGGKKMTWKRYINTKNASAFIGVSPIGNEYKREDFTLAFILGSNLN